jgi:hypothetical protein
VTSAAPPAPRAERLLYVIYGGLTLYFTAPLLVTGNNLGVEDWDVLLLYHAAVIRSVYEYGSLPFWNPWYCGGNVLWQNPQVALLSPVYLLSLVVSLPLAMKLNIVLHYLLGFAGMHVLLTRGLKVQFLPAVLFLNCLFTLAGGAVFHLAAGHATFLPYFFLPWLLFLFLCALDTGRLRYAIGTGAVMAIGVYNGGIHVMFMASVALIVFAVCVSALRHDWRPLAMLAVTGAFAFLFAAPKLLPVAAFVGDARTVDTRNIPPGPDMMGRDMVMRAFFDPFQYRRLMLGQDYPWHEYGNYLGPLGGVAIAAGFIWLLFYRRWRENSISASLALTALVLLLLTFGEFAPFAPYVLFRHVPVVSQFRLPSRYSLVFVLFAAAMVGAVWRTIGEPAASDRAKEVRRFAAIMLVVSAAAMAYWNHIQLEGVFPLAPLGSSFRFHAHPPQPEVDAVTDGSATGSPMLRAMMDNRAVLRCYEPLQLPGAIDPTRPAVFPEGGVRLADLLFEPGRIRFRAQAADRPGRLFLNQRYARGWKSDAGDFTIDPETGLAFVSLTPGVTGRFVFRFVPPGLFAGTLLLVFGVASAVALWKRTLAPRSMVQFSHAVR